MCWSCYPLKIKRACLITLMEVYLISEILYKFEIVLLSKQRHILALKKTCQILACNNLLWWNEIIRYHFTIVDLLLVRVRQCWNDFVKPTFLPKNEQMVPKFKSSEPRASHVTHEIGPLYITMIHQVDLFLYVFWKKLKTPKRWF